MQTKERTRRPHASPRKRKTRQEDPSVVYTPGKPFDRKRFFLRLATVAAIVMALVLGMSIFFKVVHINVAGSEKYSDSDVMKASGIREGENLLTLNKAKISGKIITNLPYVKSVRIGLKLPNTVLIEIVESDVVYAINDGEDKWFLIDSSGKVVDKINGADSVLYGQIKGVKLQDPQVGQPAVALEPEPTTDENGEVIPVTVLGSERLNAVLSVLKNLEANGVVGEMKSLDVSDMTMIELWYKTDYQVRLGDTENLEDKIKNMTGIIAQEQNYKQGFLDVSYTTWGDQANLSTLPE